MIAVQQQSQNTITQQYAGTVNTRTGLPPTPPLQSDGTFNGRQSPSATSSSGYSVTSAPACYYSPAKTINNVETHAQRQQVANMPRRVSMPSNSMPYPQAQFNSSQFAVSHGPHAMNAYYSNPMQPMQSAPQVSGFYYQRALPQVSL